MPSPVVSHLASPLLSRLRTLQLSIRSAIRRLAATGALRRTNGMRSFAASRSGVAAVEFALVLPFLFLLYIGVVETTQYVAADRKSIIFAKTLSDLTSQPISTDPVFGPFVNDAARDNIFALGTATLYPFSPTNAVMRITQFAIDNNGGNPRAFIDWMDTCTWQTNGTCVYGNNNAVFPGPVAPCDTDSTIARDQMTPNSYLIRGEISYHYTPIMAGLFATTVGGTDGYFNFMPRGGFQFVNETHSAPRSNVPIIRVFADGSSTYKNLDGTANDVPQRCPAYRP